MGFGDASHTAANVVLDWGIIDNKPSSHNRFAIEKTNSPNDLRDCGILALSPFFFWKIEIPIIVHNNANRCGTEDFCVAH